MEALKVASEVQTEEISQPQAVTVLGVPVHNVNMTETLDLIERYIQAKLPRHIITADASAVVTAQNDKELMDIFQNADLITPDSAGIIWASNRTDNPLNGRVSGVDIAHNLCRLSHEKGYRIFFFGAAPGIAEQAVDNLKQKFPNLVCCGIRDGFFESSDEPAIIKHIQEAQPDIILVALGIPKQEKWISQNKYVLNTPVSIGIGGSFDVFAGTVKRAPKFIQKINCEWLWRLIQNPKKIGKVMTLPRFVWLTLTRRSR